MPEYGKGIKAGILANIIISFIGLILPYPELYSSYAGLSVETYYLFNNSLISSLISGIFSGIFIGLIYAYIHEKIHIKSSKIKGLILSTTLWFIFIFLTTYFIFNNFIYLILGLVQYSILGFLLGHFWDYFDKKPKRLNIPKIVNSNQSSQNTYNKQNYKTQQNDTPFINPQINYKEDLAKKIAELKQKNPSLNTEDIDSLYASGDYYEAEKLREKREESYNEFLSLEKESKEIQDKILLLSDRLARDDLESESFNRAYNDLESQKKDVEEKLWKIHNEIFHEEYEKTF